MHRCPSCNSTNVFIDEISGKCRCRECGQVFFVEANIGEEQSASNGHDARKAYLEGKKNRAEKEEAAKRQSEKERLENKAQEELRRKAKMQDDLDNSSAKSIKIRSYLTIGLPALLTVISLCLIPRFSFLVGWLVFLLICFIAVTAIFIYNAKRRSGQNAVVKSKTSKSFSASAIAFGTTVALSIMSLVFVIVFNNKYDGYDNGYYYINNVTGVTAVIQSQSEINVPRTLDNKNVTELKIEGDRETIRKVTLPNTFTSIPQGQFASCKNLTSISIPSSVRTIEAEAFYNCGSLSYVSIPSSVETIERDAFCDCISLSSISIPYSVREISGGCFEGCKNLRTFTASSNVKIIGWSAFSGCTSLQSYNFSGVEEIGNYAFSNCSSLKSIVVPNSCRKIGEAAFNLCDEIENLELPFLGTTVTSPCTISALFSKSKYSNTDLSKLKTVKIKAGDICRGAFAGCSALTQVELPSGLKALPEELFQSKKSITSVTLPSSVKTLGDSAFSGCSNLRTIDISNVTSLGYSCFSSCSSLSISSINDSITEIPSWCFSGCASITSFTLPKNLVSIGDSAFRSTGITKLELPSSVTSIGARAFSQCDDLAELTLPCIDTSKGKNYFGYVFGAYSYDKQSSYIPEKLKKVVFTGGEQIPSTYFYGCSSITYLALPNTIKTLGGNIFSGCTSLKELHFNGTMDEWLGISQIAGTRWYYGSSIEKVICSDGTVTVYS